MDYRLTIEVYLLQEPEVIVVVKVEYRPAHHVLGEIAKVFAHFGFDVRDFRIGQVSYRHLASALLFAICK